MGTTLGFLSAYVAAAAIFYLRLTATASNGMVPKVEKHSHWHRARHLTKDFMRRMRPSLRKH